MSDDFLAELRTEVNGELGRLDAGSRWGVMISKAADAIERIARERDEARAEIERLRNGGCARDQTTTQYCAALAAALQALLSRYVELVNCGDCGFWNPEEEPEVIAARRQLAEAARALPFVPEAT